MDGGMVVDRPLLQGGGGGRSRCGYTEGCAVGDPPQFADHVPRGIMGGSFRRLLLWREN